MNAIDWSVGVVLETYDLAWDQVYIDWLTSDVKFMMLITWKNLT